MKAKDIMTTRVITIGPDATVKEIAETLSKRRISAVPVTDKDGKVLGIVSEGDLVRRKETGTARVSSWWLSLLTAADTDARRFVKSHGHLAKDIMTANVLTVPEDCPINDLAAILERNRIKRVPVVSGGKLVGIVSRADLVRAVASSPVPKAPSVADADLREAVEKAIRDKAGNDAFLNTTVSDGAVRLWGGVNEKWAKDAARVAAENVPGVRAVEDNVSVFPPEVAAVIWAE